MKNIIVQGILVVVCYVLQTISYNATGLFGVSPNIILILVIVAALLKGHVNGAFIGFACGILIDVFYGSVIGPYALLYTYIGFACGYLHRIFYKDNILVPMILVVVGDILVNFIIYILSFLLRGRISLSYYLLHLFLPDVIFTVIVLLILYKPLIYIYNKLETNQEEEEV